MNKRRIVAILATVAVVATILAGCSKSSTNNTTNNTTPANQKKQTSVKIGLSTDKGGRGDKSFNDAAIAGLDKVSSEYTVTPNILEAKKQEDYEPFLKTLAGNNDLVFGVGFMMQQAMDNVAKANPSKKFAIIDSEVKQSNVVSIGFQEEQGSFLMGVIAGKTTKTGKIGFIGGVDMPLIQKFEAGFAAGVASVNPTAAADLLSRKNVVYVGDFGDPGKGTEAAKKLFNDGCDVIFHAAGGSGLGLLDEAHKERAAGKDVWAIGVDVDQAISVPGDADAILSSMVKRVDNATYDVSKSVIENTFKGGTTMTFGLKEGGVDMAASTKNHTKQDVIDLAGKYKQAIIDGKFTVPTTLDAAKTFKPYTLQ